MIINFTASGLTQNPADYYAIHNAGSTSGDFWSSPVQYAASQMPYSDDVSHIPPAFVQISRWGDYSSAIADPKNPDAFLISNEVGVNAHHWGTANAWVLVT